MSLEYSSLNDLAISLIEKIDRSLIFPPHLSEPEELLSISKKFNTRPPRPPNGFLICRKNVHNQAKQRGICNMRVISKVTGMLWRSASSDEKEEYERLAARVVNLHTHRYPEFKYRSSSSKSNRKVELYRPYVFSVSEEITKKSSSNSTTSKSPLEMEPVIPEMTSPIQGTPSLTFEELQLLMNTYYLGISEAFLPN
ncbi:5765_t:CDS:1 [Acaulospora morrowiae]|uniref:5765_t:CDS:1 n=1 Tax=Acaulospora morrowiae TaxID=94023 RepID=A0A9N9HVP2_9GLOM|nr:5765_t:CDS:1 [Acaulospora morrowiae]